MDEILGVIGNVARVVTTHPHRPPSAFLGGAAIHIVQALVAGGARAAPVSVVGDDLAALLDDPELSWLDRTSIDVRSGTGCSFHLRYDDAEHVVGIESDYGVGTALTDHAIRTAGRFAQHHVCCRRPLDIARVLAALPRTSVTVDFFAPSISEIITDAVPHLPRVDGVFVNAAEFDVLERAVDVAELDLVVVSDGHRGARALRHGRVSAVSTPPHRRGGDTTGAGDTLAGTFLAARAGGADDARALCRAVAAAAAWVGGPRLTLPDTDPGGSCST